MKRNSFIKKFLIDKNACLGKNVRLGKQLLRSKMEQRSSLKKIFNEKIWENDRFDNNRSKIWHYSISIMYYILYTTLT
jgi:hypothetical protein